jgi:hypothetical protein
MDDGTADASNISNISNSASNNSSSRIMANMSSNTRSRKRSRTKPEDEIAFEWEGEQLPCAVTVFGLGYVGEKDSGTEAWLFAVRRKQGYFVFTIEDGRCEHHVLAARVACCLCTSMLALPLLALLAPRNCPCRHCHCECDVLV